MQYFGGKARIAKPLSEYLNSQLRDNQPFVDAFCGSCNVISKIDPNRVRIANDKHKELIALFQHLQNNGELPDNISEDQYKLARMDNRDWYRALNSISKKYETLQDVIFSSGDYSDVIIPHGAMVYCDIPYKNSTGYSTGSFNHTQFYEWLQMLYTKGIDVYVSEYADNVPNFGKVVWEYHSKKDVRDKSGLQQPTTEVLFTV